MKICLVYCFYNLKGAKIDCYSVEIKWKISEISQISIPPCSDCVGHATGEVLCI